MSHIAPFVAANTPTIRTAFRTAECAAFAITDGAALVAAIPSAERVTICST